MENTRQRDLGAIKAGGPKPYTQAIGQSRVLLRRVAELSGDGPSAEQSAPVPVLLLPAKGELLTHISETSLMSNLRIAGTSPKIQKQKPRACQTVCQQV